MALHRTDTMRMEAVRIATRVKLSGKKAGDTPPSIIDIIKDAEVLNSYYRNGAVSTGDQKGTTA